MLCVGWTFCVAFSLMLICNDEMASRPSAEVPSSVPKSEMLRMCFEEEITKRVNGVIFISLTRYLRLVTL